MSYAIWERLQKIHRVQRQGSLNFLKREFFNYKAGVAESIDNILIKFFQL